MTFDKAKWIYEADKENNIRYLLGKVGVKPLLCFGINPSTASPGELDNTLKSVERLAEGNGFDSWIMMNIYPQRSTDPNGMHQLIDSEIHKTNIAFIEKAISNKNACIWAAW
jgi:hypothetical protein